MPSKTIAFVSTYPPQRCGLASFTRDLAQAVTGAEKQVGTTILAMTDGADPRAYPDEVRFEIRRGVRDDYASAADFVNYSDIRLVSIQHEYGIFGGEDGAHILDFLSRLRVPALATLHTVLKSPTDSQRSIIEQMADRCARLVVMSELGRRLLEEVYGVAREQVVLIPHGIPDMARGDERRLKAKVGVAGRRLMLTFGLLSPNKGIETVIRAMPRLVARFPDVLYFVIGATHPEYKRRHGEGYRQALVREAHALGVADHVVFRNQFVTNEELCAYLQATDIYVTPYVSEAQSTSGALAYAMGAGAAVVSTPYWHAQEVLAEGRGCLVPAGDVEALTEAIESLLADEARLQAMRTAAYQYTRRMTWPRVGAAYAKLARQVMQEDAAPPVPARIERGSSLPDLRLDHLLRLTDDTGIIQHATYTVPSRRSGYCVDDNARALLVALLDHRITGSAETRRLITIYLSFLHHCQTDDGHFHNFVDYNRVIEPDLGSEDCMGRALWSLGAASHLAPEEGSRRLARQMFRRGMRLVTAFGPRGQALSILGLEAFLKAEPDNDMARGILLQLAADLAHRFEEESDDEWRWFEPSLTYDNAMLPLALFTAFDVAGDQRHLQVARESLAFLEEVCFAEGHLTLIGNAGWHERGGERPQADEQPIDAAAFVLAFRSAFRATGDRRALRRMRQSFDWFLGANRLGAWMYDFSTAGCRDGLGVREMSHNEGAESTISFLLALLAMLDVAGEALDEAPEARPERRRARPAPGVLEPASALEV